MTLMRHHTTFNARHRVRSFYRRRPTQRVPGTRTPILPIWPLVEALAQHSLHALPVALVELGAADQVALIVGGLFAHQVVKARALAHQLAGAGEAEPLHHGLAGFNLILGHDDCTALLNRTWARVDCRTYRSHKTYRTHMTYSDTKRSRIGIRLPAQTENDGS